MDSRSSFSFKIAIFSILFIFIITILSFYYTCDIKRAYLNIADGRVDSAGHSLPSPAPGRVKHEAAKLEVFLIFVCSSRRVKACRGGCVLPSILEIY
jgi:hypothetical protein